MAGSGGTLLLHQIRKMVRADAPALQDDELLDQFVNQRDPSAFATLVERHGPLVLSVSRRVLQETHAAEDVFQATFFVLARKASSIRKQKSLPSWLHGVAYRLAQKARTQSVRRQVKEKQRDLGESFEPGDELVRNELYSVLDEELERMPESLKLPLVLCYLQGRTRDQAASGLGCSLRTLHRRLDEGRNLLRARLNRRGVVVSATLLAATLEQASAPSAVPAALLGSTCAAGVAFAAGGMIDAACTRAAALATGAIQVMYLAKIRIVGTILAVSALAAGGGIWTYRASTATKVNAPVHEKPVQPVQLEDERADSAKKGVKTADSRDVALREKQVRNRVEALLKEAITSLEEADGGSLRNRVMADIGVLQGRLGNQVAAKATLRQAADLISPIWSPPPGVDRANRPADPPPEDFKENFGELRELAKAYANADDAEGAVEIIKRFPNVGQPGSASISALQECASILAKARREKDASRFMKLIKDEESTKWMRPLIQTELVHAVAKAGNFTKAMRMLDDLSEIADKIQALVGISWGNLSYSEDPAEPGICFLQSQAGDAQAARKSLNLAIELSIKLPKDHKSPRAMASILIAQARLGDETSVLELVDKVEDKLWKGKALVAIARAYAARGKEKEARQIIDSIHDPEMKSYGLYQLAAGQHQAQRLQDARESLEEAIKVTITSGKNTNLHFHNIATAMALIGDYDKAIETAREHLSGWPDLTICNIAWMQADAGDFKGARETVQKVENDMWQKGKMLRHIAKIDVEHRKSLDPPDWVALISSPYEKANVLLGVAEGLAERIKGK
jgi:RNA polymerase sigma factor (sigma-70 family)